MCPGPLDGMLHYTEIFHGEKTLRQAMIKYFYKSRCRGSDRVVRREMVLSCRRKYSAALVVDLY